MSIFIKTVIAASAMLCVSASLSLAAMQKYILLDPNNPNLITVVWMDKENADGTTRIQVFDKNFGSGCTRPFFSTETGTVKDSQNLVACTASTSQSYSALCKCGQ